MTVGILGLGLIGGSIAKALKKNRNDLTILAYDINPKSLEEAKSETMIGGKTETLQKRSATPEEQAATILYMASDESAHITGSIIMSDGGYTAY